VKHRDKIRAAALPLPSKGACYERKSKEGEICDTSEEEKGEKRQEALAEISRLLLSANFRSLPEPKRSTQDRAPVGVHLDPELSFQGGVGQELTASFLAATRATYHPWEESRDPNYNLQSRSRASTVSLSDWEEELADSVPSTPTPLVSSVKIDSPHRRPLGEKSFNDSKVDLATWHKHAMRRGQRSNRARLLPIAEQGTGKIRIAALHRADHSWAARSLSRLTIPLLKNVHTTRDTLRDTELYLKPSAPGALVHSADFSKSTDPLSVDFVQWFYSRLPIHLGFRPDWWDDAVKTAVQNLDIEWNGRIEKIKCGALMSLGPGWTMVALISAFAANNAGAPKESYAICGDDLVGIWTSAQFEAYAQVVEAMGMKLNRKKTFIGMNGVFCEKFIIPQGDHYVSVPLLRMGQAAAVRKGGKAGPEVLDGLTTILYRQKKGGSPRVVWIKDPITRQKSTVVKMVGEPMLVHKELRRLAEKTVSQIRVSKRFIPGPHMYGGSGKGPCTRMTVKSYLMFGPVQHSHSKYEAPGQKELKANLKNCLRTPGGVPISDVLTSAKTQGEINHRAAHGTPTKTPKPLTRLQYVREFRRRITAVRKAPKISTLLKAREYFVKNKKGEYVNKELYCRVTVRLTRKVRSHLRARRWSRALDLLTKSWDEPVSHAKVSQHFLSTPLYRSSVKLPDILGSEIKRFQPPQATEAPENLPIRQRLGLLVQKKPEPEKEVTRTWVRKLPLRPPQNQNTKISRRHPSPGGVTPVVLTP